MPYALGAILMQYGKFMKCFDPCSPSKLPDAAGTFRSTWVSATMRFFNVILDTGGFSLCGGGSEIALQVQDGLLILPC